MKNLPKGIIMIPREGNDEDQIFSIALEDGADDVKTDVNSYQVITPQDNFDKIKKAFEKENIKYSHAELTRVPQNSVTLDEKTAERVLKLYELLEEHEDVQQVFGNFDISEEIMEKLSAEVMDKE